MSHTNDRTFWTDIRAGLLARVAAVERDPIRSRDPFWIDMRAADKGMAAAIGRQLSINDKPKRLTFFGLPLIPVQTLSADQINRLDDRIIHVDFLPYFIDVPKEEWPDYVKETVMQIKADGGYESHLSHTMIYEPGMEKE